MDLSGEKGEPYLGELPEKLEEIPGTESGIAEVFELLRRKGMNDQEIIVEIFKRDINADVQEIQRITGLDSMAVGRLKGTVTRSRKAEKKKADKAGEKGEGGAHREEDKSILRGEVDANRILERILEHPDVPNKVREDILLLAEDTPGGIHPQALIGIILGYKGITQNLANFLAMRYNMALTKAAQEGKIQSWPVNPSMMGMSQGSQYGWGGMGWQPGMGTAGFGGQGQPPWGGQPSYGSGGYNAGGYTERDISRMRQDWDKEKKLESLERSVADLVRDLPNTIKNAMPQVEGQYEEVTEYIDKNGKLCGDPEKAFSLRSIRRPITSAPRESSDVRELKEKVDSLTKSLQDKTIGDLEKSIKALTDKVDGMGRRPEESPEMRDLKTQLDQTRTTLSEMKESMASKERETLMAKIDGLEDRISSYARGAGDWKTDEAKLIASELGEIGSIVKEIAKKDRIGLVRELIIPESSKPPTETPPEEARGGVIEGLRKYGYTARVIQR